MKTTTTYVQRLTITTDDDGSRTITRTSRADTATEYLFDELSPEAQERAVSDAIEEETKLYYSGDWYASQTGISERDVLDAAEELAKAQNIEVTQDQGCSWYGTARGSWYHHRADWEAVTEQQHNGMSYSMDICDRWNEYARRIIALQEGHEEAEDRAYLADTQEEQDAYNDIAERIEAAAEELTEEAARAVGDTVDGLIEGERDYYTSPEFWREWYANGDERFTREGERI